MSFWKTGFNILRICVSILMSLTLVYCGGQPEDDLDPEDVFDPPLVITSPTTVEGGNLLFEMTLEYTALQDITFDYNVTGDTAEASDFPPTSGTFLIPLGTNTATLTIPTSQDPFDEDDETVLVNFENPSGLQLPTVSATGTIADDDPPPSLIIADVNATEGTSAILTVSVSVPSEKAIAFNYTAVDGSALAPGDYFVASGSGALAPNQLTTQISVATADDLVPETPATPETFAVNFTAIQNALPTALSATVSILDDDIGNNPHTAFTSVSAGEGIDLEFVVTFEFANTIPMNFDAEAIDISSTAAADYTFPAQTFTVTPGALSIAITVPGLDDVIYENNEEFLLSLSNFVNLNAGDITVVGTILDDEPPPNLSVLDVSLSEATAEAVVQVTLSWPSFTPVSFNYMANSGTANAGLDFSAISGVATIDPFSNFISFSIPIADDPIDEPLEDFTFNVFAVTNASVTDSSATIFIADNDLPPDLSISDGSVDEGDPALLIVSLSEQSAFPITFDIQTYDNTAVNATDYSSLNTNLSIAPGDVTLVVPLATTEDSVHELSEDYVVSLSNAVNAGFADDLGQVSIIDDDPPPDIQISDYQVIEGETLQILISLSATSDVDVTFDYSALDGTATAPTDFPVTSGTETISAGGTFLILQIPTVQDVVVEPLLETFQVTLSNVTGASLLDVVADANVLDDDIVPDIFVSDDMVDEGDTVFFVVSIDFNAVNDTSFTYSTFDGTASQPGDYLSATGDLTFSPGRLEITIPVTTVDNLLDNPDKEFSISLTSVNFANIADDFGVATIADNEPSPFLFVAGDIINEGDTGSHIVSLSEVSGQDVEFVFYTLDIGSATAATDFSVIAAAQTISAGQSQITISSSSVQELVYESDEVYMISLGGLINADPGNVLSAVTILNEDPVPGLQILAGSVIESESATLRVTILSPSEVDAVYTYETLDQSAVAGTDYLQISTTTATIPAGSVTGAIEVVSVDDAIIQGDLTFLVSFDAIADVSLSGAPATVTILENDIIPDIFVFDADIVEGGTAYVLISLSTGGVTDVTFDYATFDGTAISGGDYLGTSGSGTISAFATEFTLAIGSVEDLVDETAEVFEVSLSNVLNGSITDDLGLVSIADDDAFINILDTSANEGTTLTLIASLTNPQPQDVVFFASSTDSTATAGADYTAQSAWFTIVSGLVAVAIDVVSTQDLVDEDDEYFDVDLSSITGAQSGDLVGVGTILDDDLEPQIFIDDGSVTEAGTIAFVISLSEASERDISFDYDSYDIGSAVAGSDFTMASTNYTLVAGLLQTTLSVATLQDTLNEATETFDVSLANLVNVLVGDLQGVGSILDDDPLPSLFINDAEVDEGDTASLLISLSEVSGQAITFTWSTQDGTATGGTDYTTSSETVTINAGFDQVAIEIPSIDDGLNEGNLNFFVTLTGLVNVAAGDISATITIDDDEDPPEAPTGLSLNDPASSPSNDATPEILISGVDAGFQVRLYTDSACAGPVSGSAFVAGGASMVSITASPALAEGAVTIYATQENLTPVESACSTANVVYEVDLTAPFAATSLSLTSNYSPDANSSPTFTWLPSVSPDAITHEVALGTSAGGEETVTFSAPDTGTSHTFSSITLTECSGGLPVYWPSVRVTDLAGNVTVTSHANGFRYDISNPGPTGTPTAAGNAASDRASTAVWSAGTDNCDVGSYEIAIGTTAGATDILGWKDIGNQMSYQAIDGVDGVSITISNGVFYYTSVRTVDEQGLKSTLKTSSGWRFITPPDAVTDLGFAGRTSSSVDLSWSAPNDNGAAITDYTVEYKNSTVATWTVFADGTSSDTSATVDGLLASTNYDFRVKAYNGGLSAASNTLTQETAPDDPFFDPSLYSAMNLGGATDSAFVALDDNTVLVLNGTTTLSSLDAGSVTVLSTSLGDVVTSEKQFFVAGRLRNGSSDQEKGNIVWNTPSWSGKEFLTVGSRDPDHIITVYAFEEAVITIASGATTYVDGVTVAAGTTDTYSLPNNVAYTIEATTDIVAYQYSEQSSGSRVTDHMPLLPPATDIIGVPSRTGQYTTIETSTSYNWYESNNTSGSGTLNFGSFASQGGNGAQYGSPAARVIANDPIIGRSNADSDGYNSSTFVPKAFQRQRYAVNHLSEWVAFVSDKPAVIQVFSPGQAQSSITLSRTGSNTNTPYFGRLTAVPQGTIFESNTRFAAWYESDEAAEASSSREDETVLFGYDGVGLPVHHKLHLWLDASDSDTLFQQDDCTSVVSADSEPVGCWMDKSPQGNHATQSGAKPTWDEQVSGFAGQPGVDFNGGSQFLNFDQSRLDGNNYTVFAVVHRDDNSTDNYFIGTQTSSPNQGFHMGYNADGSARVGQYSNELSQSITGQSENSVGLFYGRLNSSGKKLFYNGIETTDADNTQLSSPGQGVIGRGFDSNGFDGQVAEIIVFSRDLSDTEVDLIVEYLKEKWMRPSRLSDIRLWLDSQDTSTMFTDTSCSTNVTTPTATIGCWKDKSGNGYEAIASTGTVQWITDSSQNVVQFINGSLTISGGTSGAVFSNSSTLSAAEVFAYMKSSSSIENGNIFHHPAGNGFKIQVPNNRNVHLDLDAGASGSISAAWGANTSTYYRWNMYSSTALGAQAIYRDDTSVTSDSDASSISIGTETFTIGAEDGNSNFQNMYMGNLIIFSRALSAGERHMIRAYIDMEW